MDESDLLFCLQLFLKKFVHSTHVKESPGQICDAYQWKASTAFTTIMIWILEVTKQKNKIDDEQ